MPILVECYECKKVIETEVSNLTESIIWCSENKSIFSGILCNECAKKLDEEN